MKSIDELKIIFAEYKEMKEKMRIVEAAYLKLKAQIGNDLWNESSRENYFKLSYEDRLQLTKNIKEFSELG